MKIGNSLFNFALVGLCALSMAPRLSAQTFTVNPTSMSLNAPASSTSPVSQAMTVSVTGGGGQTLSVSAVSPPTNTWLRVVVSSVAGCQSPVTGCNISNPSSVSVTVQASPAGLAQGTYSGQVNLTLTGSPNPSVQVPITFTVGAGTGSSGVLTASPTSLAFSALPGASGQSQNVSISNTGNSIAYTVSSNVAWLSTNLGGNQGISPGLLTVTASAASLPANTYAGSLTLTPNGGGQTTTIPVTFVVSSAQQFQINPSALTFSYINGSAGANPTANLAIGVTTGSPIAYSVSTTYGAGPTGWLVTSPLNGGTTGTSVSPTNLGVTANAASLAIGSYSATLSFSAAGLTTVNIPVTLTVSSAPTFTVSPTPLSISVQPSTVASRSLSINTSNNASVNYNVTSQYVTPPSPSVLWLNIANGSGVTPNAATIGVNPGALAVGTYTALLTITSSTAGVASTTVTVTMTVTNSQIVTFSPGSLSFNFVGGGATPAAQSVALGLTPATPAQSASVFGVPDVLGQTWLSATLSSPSGSQISGSTSAVVTVNPTGLANGTYTGKVQINIFGAVSNSLVEIPVSFTVSGVTGGGGGGTGTQTVLLSQSQFNFNTTPGGVAPDQTLAMTSSTTTQIPYSLSTPNNWITILPGSGTTPGSSVIRVNTSGLPVGTSQGQVILTAAGASNNGLGIPVTVTISSTNQLQTTPSGFTFSYSQTGAFPPAQTLQLSSSTGSTLPVTATVTTTTGGAWLNVTPSSVNTLGNMLISVNSAILQGLGAGTYTGNISLQATGAANATVNVPVSLVITTTSGGGGGGGTGADQLILGPNPMNFYSNLGGSAPAQTLDINSISGTILNASLSFTTSSGGNWLSVNPANATTPGQVTVSVNSSSLAVGTYSGGITVTSPGTINSGTTVPVTLTVSSNTNLVASPAGFTYSYVPGGAALPLRVITLSTTNNVAVPITVTTDSESGRLTVSTNSSTTPASITVSLNPVGLTAGVYTATILVNGTGAANSTLRLPVTLIVTGGTGGGAAQLAVNPTSLNFFGQPNGTPPQQRTVQVTSTGSAISYSVSTNQAWLQAAPSSGTTPGSVTVGVNPSGLAAGTYSGNVTLTGGGSTVNLTVTFEVTNNPLLQLSQQSVTYNYQTGQALPAPRPILVTTSNGSSLTASVNVTTSSGGNWLLASPTSLQTPGAFALSLANSIVSTLAAGTYTGTVTVNAPGAANANATINVTLNVSSSPLLTMSTTPITFNAQFNGNQPPAQARQITATSGVLSVTVSTSTNTGSSWLSANINSNNTPATLTISASPFNLGTGIYTGSVTVTSGSSASALVIPVTLNISSLPLISIDKSELIFGSGGNSGTQPQTIQISSSSTNFNYSVQASVTNSPTNWLSVSNVNGVTPSTMTVNVNPALLGDGTYFGTIVISAPGAGNSPLVIPITLTVNQATALQTNPTSLSFTQVQGAVPPAQQPIQVTSQLPTSFSVTSAVQTPVGGNWLSVNPSGGLTNGFLQASINSSASSLPVGTYTGTITVFGANSPNSIPITVTLTVVSSATLQVTPINLTFTGRVGQPNPPAQTVQLTSSNAATQLTYNVTSDAAWLTGTPVSGNTPATISVAVNIASLPAGVFSGIGRLTVTPTGAAGIASGQPVAITVNLQVDQTPVPNITGFANAATFQPGALAPGMIISLVGTNLGPTQAVNGQVVAGRFTTALTGVRVLFDGIAAPILYASATQINTVVPYSLAGRASARMSVEYNNVASNTIEPRLVDTAPGIFTADGRQAAMINENGTFNSASNPAPTGSIVVIYVTGEGATSPAGVDGEVIGSTLKRPIGAVRVRVGGIEVPAADIFYAGSAPTLVSGLMQINFRLPANTPTGINTQVEVFVGAGQSQPGVTMSVR